MGDQEDHQEDQETQDQPDYQELHAHQSAQRFVFQLVHNTVAQQERRSKLTKLLWMGTRATDLTHRIPTTNERNTTIMIYLESMIIYYFFNLVCLTGINLVGNNFTNL